MQESRYVASRCGTSVGNFGLILDKRRRTADVEKTNALHEMSIGKKAFSGGWICRSQRAGGWFSLVARFWGSALNTRFDRKVLCMCGAGICFRLVVRSQSSKVAGTRNLGSCIFLFIQVMWSCSIKVLDQYEWWRFSADRESIDHD